MAPAHAEVRSPTRFALIRKQTGLSRKEVAERLEVSLRTVYRWERGETQPDRATFELVKQWAAARSRGPKVPRFTFIDLFAGIGGMRMGFEAAGGKCVFTCEWNPWCQQTYLANFEADHPIHGDIRGVAETDIPPHDVLLAGFPCQPFSIAGVSKKNALGRPHGFRCETQGTLFFEIARILAWHRPAAFLLENVRNLVSHDRGRTFEVILRTLRDELGYHVQWRIIDARSWVPQHRERIFIAGFREDTGFCFDGLAFPRPDQAPRLRAILHPEDGTEEAEPPYTEGPKAKVAAKYTLSEKLWKYLQEYSERHKRRGNGFGYGLFGPDDVARTLSARYYKDGSEILIRQRGAPPRRLTPRECARLMGFDGPGRPLFRIPVSDTRAYQQFGNAVVVPVVESVAKLMLPHILELRQDAETRQLRLPLVGPGETKDREMTLFG
ncbi:MAG: DNA (cytosine-5-)-methyltransferase [Phycisphaerales bacterium]|nr:DNA (cytosine-5-)-methyltransferase [Phycisphaerales bacterium]